MIIWNNKISTDSISVVQIWWFDYELGNLVHSWPQVFEFVWAVKLHGTILNNKTKTFLKTKYNKKIISIQTYPFASFEKFKG